MMIPFEKYHGCGNNFILFDYEDVKQYQFPALARSVCDIHAGIGADGMIIVKQHPLEMIFYNQDGSRAPMCGNGIRCFAKYVWDKKMVDRDCFPVETMAGTMMIQIKDEGKFKAKVNMGKPSFDIEKLHLSKYIFDIKEYELEGFTVGSLFMGTIHTVVFVDSLDSINCEEEGKKICFHPLFKEKTNVNFVEIMGEHNMRVMTYERGVGLTKACGSGCCASVVLANDFGKVSSPVNVHLELGVLRISIVNDEVIMEGPAQKTAVGMYDYQEVK